MTSILSQYDMINKVRNLEQNKKSIREYYERINNFFIVELDYRNKTKDVTLSEKKLIWLTFVIEKWIKEIKNIKLFDYLANKSVKNLFDAYIIAKRKMLKKKRKFRQKKKRKFQKKYQMILQQFQEFVDRDIVDRDVTRIQKSHESSLILKEQQSILKKNNATVNITNIVTLAKSIVSESTISQRSSFEFSTVYESPPILKKISCNLLEISTAVVDSSDIEFIYEILAFGSRKWPASSATLFENSVDESSFILEEMSCDWSEISTDIVNSSDIETIDEVFAFGSDKWIVVAAEKKIFDFTSTFANFSKNQSASHIDKNIETVVSNNSFDWNRCCTVDMKILNQEIFALIVTYDAFSKNSPASFIENMKISVAMNMSSLKHLTDMNNSAIETFDSDIAMSAFLKNSSIQQIEDPETMKKTSDSIYIYELFALSVFDPSIDINFEIYTIDIEAVIQSSVASLRSFRDFALRHNSFDWNRCSTNFIGSRTSVSICTSTSAVTSITSDVILDSIETVDTVDTDFYEGEQSLCFSVDDIVDAVCIAVVVEDIDAPTLTAGLVNTTKNSARMSLLGSVVDLAPKSKHKRLPKVKIKNI